MAIVKANFSSNYWAMVKHIQRLPKILEKTIDTVTKKDADAFLEEFKNGIRNNDFGLTQLKPDTVKQKIRSGYSRPNTPLYGAGDSEKNSYINALRIRKLKKGYRVYISKAKHHKSKLSLAALFEVHEKGALIKTDKSIIRIPPRPTRSKAFKRLLAKRLREENTKKAREVIINYLKTGNVKGL